VLSSNCKGIPRAKWPHDRFEFFLLFEGESMVVCDSAMRLGIITIDDGRPCLLSLTPLRVVDYIAAMGMRSRGHRAVVWAIKNIETILREHPKAGVRKLRELEDHRDRLCSLA
jgi:hypothetical protein